jgi:hypothetical protein
VESSGTTSDCPGENHHPQQAEMSLGEYIQEGKRLQKQIVPSQLISLCQWWLLGLNDQLSGHIAITAWAKFAEGDLSFDSIVHYVKYPGAKYSEKNRYTWSPSVSVSTHDWDKASA